MKSSKVIKSAIIVMIVTLISKVLGLGRDMLVAYNFGAGALNDAYNVAVTIPDTVFTLIGLAISTTFIPMLSQVKVKEGKKSMFKFSNNIITILTIIAMVLFILGIIFTEDIVKIFASGFDDERMKLAISLTRISLINILFLSVNACYTAMLQVCEDFIIPSILGLFFNLPIILYLMLFKNTNVLGLTIANVIGNALRVIAQLPSLFKHGYRIQPFINLKDKRVKRILILVLPVIIGAGANSLNMIVDKKIASYLGAGTISALDYAQKLIIFANTAITTSIVTVMYPLMANKINEDDKEGFTKYLFKCIVMICVFLIPIMMAFILLKQNIISLVYGRGKFDEGAVVLTSLAFLGYSFQLPFYGVRDILNSSLFSMQKTRETTINGVIGVMTNILLSLALFRVLGIIGIALASSIAAAVTSILLLRTIKNVIGNYDIVPTMKKILKIIVATIIMSVILIFIKNVILYKFSNQLVILIINFIIGVLVFGFSCVLLKVEEFYEVIKMIKKKIKKA